MAIITPKQAAVRPRNGAFPDNTATIDMPRSEKASSSGEPRYRMIGRITGMATAMSRAPKTPPSKADIYEAPSALPPAPCLVMGKPSSTVAAEAAWPGAPNTMAEIGSAVVVVDPRPRSSAKAACGSISNVNGSSSAIPAIPPMPGRMPSASPMHTPATSTPTLDGSRMIRKARPTAFRTS